MSNRILCLIAAMACLSGGIARAEPTHVTIRALADDAKFIGSSMGGVRVTLTDVKSGKRLAQGLTEGGTGDTKRIVGEPRERGKILADASAAAFQTTLDLDQPTLVKAEGFGPVGKPDSAITVSSMRWILPGHDLSNDGWILSFPGLVVEPSWSMTSDNILQVASKVTLMCGCPIEPGGHWNAGDYVVRASLRGKRGVREVDLAYAGKPSAFAGAIDHIEPGRYTLRITATNARSLNSAVTERKVIVPHVPTRLK
jgi:hypothetical protein